MKMLGHALASLADRIKRLADWLCGTPPEGEFIDWPDCSAPPFKLPPDTVSTGETQRVYRHP